MVKKTDCDVIYMNNAIHMSVNNRPTMNERNGEIPEPLTVEEDADNLPHNLARFARTSYSKKVSQKYHKNI